MYQAGMWAAYLAGLEVLLRMTKTSFFWEGGKYGIIMLLLLGLTFSVRKKTPTFLIFFILLLPSISLLNFSDIAEVRDFVSFNLSGPLCLAVSATYFYRITLTSNLITTLVRYFVFPIISILVYLSLKTPDVSDIAFRSSSNFAASGGFGPNQVSLILGIGIFLIVLLNFYNLSLSGIKIIDYGLTGLLLFRAFVTFSRGGVFGAGLAILVLFVSFFWSNPHRLNVRYIILSLIVGGVLLYVWDYANKITESTLTYRYESIDPKTGMERDITTGRELLFLNEVEMFEENLAFGVGPGMASKYHEKQFGQLIASHSEYSRMISEHGLFGVLALLILVIAPLRHILREIKIARPLLVAILIISLFSMLHSAMRLGAIGFLYGWVFLIVPLYNMKVSPNPRV